MFSEFLSEVQHLIRDKEPFAMAMVINRVHPSSGKPGDKAVITPDGKVVGWIGGGCTRGIVIKEALEAIQTNKPRVVRIQPDGEPAPKNGVVDYKMTCHSGGTVEIYIEPVLPNPHIVILGKSHVAMALGKIAPSMGYAVTVMAPHAEQSAFPNVERLHTGAMDLGLLQPNSFIVVCTQGENDEDALEFALQSGISYISFVASRRKANAVFKQLRDRGVTFDQLKNIKTPAGVDINAKLPEEVAISILAEIIQNIRSDNFQVSGKPTLEPATRQESTAAANRNSVEPSGLYINPVCGIPVDKATAKHVLEYHGAQVYFCCDGCKVSFEKEPEKYVKV